MKHRFCRVVIAAIYVRETTEAWTYAIEVDGEPAGGIGFWWIESEASNGICRSVGFIDLGERNSPFRDTVLRTRAWAFEHDDQG